MQKDKIQIWQNANSTKYKKTIQKYDKTHKDKTQKWQYTNATKHDCDKTQIRQNKNVTKYKCDKTQKDKILLWQNRKRQITNMIIYKKTKGQNKLGLSWAKLSQSWG